MSPLKSKKILVVDDDDLLREAMKDIFSFTGCTLFEAENGTKAFEIVQRETLDLVISDVRMPGCDGIQLATNVSQMKDPKPKFIICSGYNDLTPAKASQLGILKLFEKPFDADELVKFAEDLFRN